MAFISLFFIICQFNVLQSVIYEDVPCDTAESSDTCILHCDANTIIPQFSCGNAGQCYFYCQNHQCMQDGILYATNSNNLYAYSSHNECFKNTQIYTPNAGNASIAINNIDEKELKLMRVYGGINTQSIRINCTGSNKETCKQIQVYAENTKYLQIIGSTPSIMEDAIINCPINSTYDGIPCNIDFSAGGIIKDGTFNTANGIPTDIMITGTLEGAVTITCSEINGVSKNNGNSFQNQGDCWITEPPTTDIPTTYSQTIYPTTTTQTITDPPTTDVHTTDSRVDSTTQSQHNPTTDPTSYSTKVVTSDPTMLQNPDDNQIIIAEEAAQSTSTTINRAENAEQTQNTEHPKDIGSSSDNIDNAASNNGFNFADHILKLCLLSLSIILLGICACFLYCSNKKHTLNNSKSIENSMQSHQNDASSAKPDNNINNTDHNKSFQEETIPKLPSNQPSLKIMLATKSNRSNCSDIEESVEGVYNDDIYMKDYDIMDGITDAGLDEIVINDEYEDIGETKHDTMSPMSEDSIRLYGNCISAEINVFDNDVITSGGKLPIVLEDDQEEAAIQNDDLQIKMEGTEDVNMHKRNNTYYGADISIPDTPNIPIPISPLETINTCYGDV